CLLRAVKQARAEGRAVRAAYVPDAELGTRWFADKSVWVRDGDNFLPFTTGAAADRYLRAHPTGGVVTYDRAVEEVRQ
ncbi:ABC transporter substrate-binding protein, partial [Rhodococcus wratislaviensis IFP 2016]